ncbi:MAG: hypothetical protein U0798_18615 [Gemmataceae bacterium]
MKSKKSKLRQRSLFLEKLDDRINPAIIEVTSLDDTGVGSLRQAILDANADPDQDTIVFSGSAVGGTISLTSRGGTNYGPNAFEITSEIEIQGSSSMAETLKISSGSDTTMRHFYVSTNGNLTLNRIQLTGGIAQGGDGGNNFAAGGGGAGMGGAIFNQGTLTLKNSTLSGNQALGGKGGSGSNNYAGGGGGMFGDGGTGRPDGGSGGGGGFFGNGGNGGKSSSGRSGGGGGGTNSDGQDGSEGGLGGSENGGNGGNDSNSGNGQDGSFGGGGGGGSGGNRSSGQGGIGGGGGGSFGKKGAGRIRRRGRREATIVTEGMVALVEGEVVAIAPIPYPQGLAVALAAETSES